LEELNKRESEILHFIKSETSRKGYPPSVREIGMAVGLKSSSTVHGYLNSLEEKGYIRRNPSKPRAIEILDDTSISVKKEMVNIPLVGRITAGSPILAQESVEDVYPLPYDLVRADNTFMLNVTGDSMVGAGILEGDMLIVKKQNYASNGDIVVALLEDEATVKTFYKEAGHVRLQPENEYMEPIIVNDVLILGKVIGLIRKY
jgi:repressor LexA